MSLFHSPMLGNEAAQGESSRTKSDATPKTVPAQNLP
jgi:hypothetical protein